MAARKATNPPYSAVDVFQAGKHLRFDHLIRQFGAKAEVKLHKQFTWNNVVTARSRLNIGNLHTGRRESRTLIPLQ